MYTLIKGPFSDTYNTQQTTHQPDLRIRCLRRRINYDHQHQKRNHFWCWCKVAKMSCQPRPLTVMEKKYLRVMTQVAKMTKKQDNIDLDLGELFTRGEVTLRTRNMGEHTTNTMTLEFDLPGFMLTVQIDPLGG